MSCLRAEKASWFLLLAAACFLVVVQTPSIKEAYLFFHGNPAFPLLKGANSPPYCIGIVNSIGLSIFRVITGTALGFTVGAAIGIILAQLTYLGRRVYRFLLFFAPLAPLVWLPVLFKSLGIGNATAILIVSAGSVFVTAVVTYYLALNCRESYVSMIRLMGGNRKHILSYVVLPSLVPMLLLLLRINFFAGWMAVLAAEMAGIDQGLGAMLIMGRSLGNLHIVALAAVLIAIFAFAVDRTISYLAFRLVRKRYGAWIFTRS
jgi:NitT/TauT family transport system permease protein